MPHLHTNGIDLYYEIHGSGEPLVLITGIGYDLWAWHKMVPHLEGKFQVILFDNRGVGKTDKPEGPYSAEMMADDTAGLLMGLGIDRANIFGHSMGGFVAQALVLKYPELVDKLILASTNFGGPRHIPVTPEAMAVLMDITGDPMERFKRGLLVSCAPGFGESNPEVIDEWMAYRERNPILPGPYQSQLAVGLGLISEESSFEERLKEVRASTLVLFGAEDKVAPPGNAELLGAQIPESRIEILDGVGHFLSLEAPEVVAEVVLDFLAEG
jgi:pimeloyl-ACP methyl ester carboxylesterase